MFHKSYEVSTLIFYQKSLGPYSGAKMFEISSIEGLQDIRVPKIPKWRERLPIYTRKRVHMAKSKFH